MNIEIGTTIKGYQIREKIGEGGFALVYRAYQPALAREVAIKVILPQHANNPDFVRRFETEAQTVARLEHIHIVPLYDYWREPDNAFLVMRWIRGGSLANAIDGTPWELGRATHFFDQVADGLYAAHRGGVVHRDIKPDNMLLDEDGNAYLTDFGIAQLVGKKGDADGSVSGSIGYVAPEQLTDDELHPQTDIYALGLVLYEMLVGEHVYKGATISQIIQNHLYEPIPNICDKRDLPTAVNDVLQRATAKEPLERFATARDFAVAFNQALSPSPIVVQPDDAPLINPYKGLRSFEQADADDFFGRDRLVGELLGRLQEPVAEQHFLAVVGASGSGKSSVVKAGLLPALRKGALPQSENWFIAQMTPGTQPLKNLEQALLTVAITPPSNLSTLLKSSEQGLSLAVKRVLGETATHLVLVIDQFEEAFTLCEDEGERNQFLTVLANAVSLSDSQLWVIATLRADFFDRPLQHGRIGQLFQKRTQVVLPMSTEELENAITLPAQRAGASVDSDLLAQLIGDVQAEPGALPLLQYALTELFERRDGRRLTLASYQASGGVTGALARKADDLLAQLSPSEQALAQQVFLRLVTLGEGKEDTRRRARLSELQTLVTSEHSHTLTTVLNTFGTQRLLTFDTESETREPTVEVAHEALIRTWRRLRDWLDQSRDDIRLQRQLASAMQDWQKAQRDNSYLLNGGRLAQFDEWSRTTHFSLTPNERAYIEASVRVEGQRYRLLRNLRVASVAFAIISVLAIVAVAYSAVSLSTANQTAQTAQAQAQNANDDVLRANNTLVQVATDVNIAQSTFQAVQFQSETLRLASLAREELDNENIEFASLLAIRSLRMQDNVTASLVLQNAYRGLNTRTLMGHEDEIFGVAFSPDSQYVLSGSRDSTAKLWQRDTGELIRTFTGHTDTVSAVAYHPDGEWIATGSEDLTINVWDVNTGDIIRTFSGQQADIRGIAFSHNGLYLASASDDKTVVIWEVATGKEIWNFVAHDDFVSTVAFSPDDRFILTGSYDGTAKLWDISGDTIPDEATLTLQSEDLIVIGVAFSPDGQYALTGGFNKRGVLWNLETGVIIREFVGHTDVLWGLGFSPDGRFVYTASDDTTVRLWDIETAELLQVFAVGEDALNFAVAPDGNTIAVGTNEYNVKLWDVARGTEERTFAMRDEGLSGVALTSDGTQILMLYNNGELYKIDRDSGASTKLMVTLADRVSATNISADDRLMAIATRDLLVTIWDLQTGELVQTITGLEDMAWDVSFSADARLLLTGSRDGKVRLWEVATATEILEPLQHEEPITAVLFSPDGKFIGTGSGESVAKLWDINTGELLNTYEDHDDWIESVAFSSDGKLLLTASDDATVKLWDVDSAEVLYTFRAISAIVVVVVFSPNDQRIVAGYENGDVVVWDVNSKEIVFTLRGHTASISDVKFAPDNETVITSSEDNTVKVWNISLPKFIERVCQRLVQSADYVRDFTDEERILANLPDDQATCPQP
jgi:WD40 repeat protein/serine/threonine protein kinase